MKFFIPHASSPEESERVYEGIARFNDAPIGNSRISGLTWLHEGQKMSCSVGGPLPDHYGTGAEPVLAIYDCGTLYKLCTPSRGGLRGESVFAGKNSNSHATHFEP